ncbi:MAG: HAMP domain-containing histidine kinase [Ruminococcaceae bacterium]|nr:HAMP domain-containing histidine kinase [Oscillospiraceae bacterium]
MLKKLRLRFILIIMAIVTVMLLAIVFTVVHSTRKNLEAESLRIMESIAADPMQLGTYTEEQGGDFPFFALQIGRHNEIMAISGGHFDLSDETVLEDLLLRTLNTEQPEGELPEYHLRYCRRITWDSCTIAFADIRGEDKTVARVTRACVLIGVASFFIFLLISFLLARLLVKPVEASWAQQRQFISDASHELKTPLTVILTNAELMQSPDYDAEAKEQFSDNILTMAKQMRGLVEDLLDLARVDNGLTRAVWERVDLSRVLSDAALPFEPLYFESGLELDSFIEPGIFVRGSADHLRRVAEILLDNARKYSDPGHVRFCLQRQGKNQCVISVANPGAPISRDDLQNIFKRFYRADAARSRDGSYGLGLPIAQGIAGEHGGRIWAASAGGFNTFYVCLPTTA